MANEETKAKLTFDHGTIKKWAEDRGAIPSSKIGTEDEGQVAGILSFDFTGDPTLDPLTWDEFFNKFEKEKLALLLRDKEKDGSQSQFYEFENRV
jgi:hypothetical protein